MSAQQLPRKPFLQIPRGRLPGDEHAVTLVVGEIARWTSDGRIIPDVRDLTYVEFEELSANVLETIRPDVILSPLVLDSFDAFQVMNLLTKWGYEGRYRAVSQHLPNLPMICREIKAEGPYVDFDIVIMPPTLVSVT